MSREFPPTSSNEEFRGLCIEASNDKKTLVKGKVYTLTYEIDRMGNYVNVLELGPKNPWYIRRFTPIATDDNEILKSFINNEPGSKEEFYQLVRRITA